MVAGTHRFLYFNQPVVPMLSAPDPSLYVSVRVCRNRHAVDTVITAHSSTSPPKKNNPQTTRQPAQRRKRARWRSVVPGQGR